MGREQGGDLSPGAVLAAVVAEGGHGHWVNHKRAEVGLNLDDESQSDRHVAAVCNQATPRYKFESLEM